jgi:hypothetical protein
MLFNNEKCKVMHFGYSIVKSVYKMGDQKLEVISLERYLGVIIQNDFKQNIDVY